MEEALSKISDFKQEEGKIPLVVIAPYADSYSEAILKFMEGDEVQVVESKSPQDAVIYASKMDSCMILCHAPEAEDAVQLIPMLKHLKTLMGQGRTRVILTTFSEDVSVLGQMAFHGVAEVVREPVTGRALVFKLQRHFKTLKQAQIDAISEKLKGKVKKDPLATPINPVIPAQSEALFRFTAPLEISSDFWILADGNPKKFGGRWVMRLQGPSEDLGEWKKGDSENQWIWCIKDPAQHPYVDEGGSWTFQGQKPEFKKNFWWFIGPAPDLSFYSNGIKVGSKLALDSQKVFVLARNSFTADVAKETYDAVPAPEPKKTTQVEKPAFNNALDPTVKWDPVYNFVEPLNLPMDFWSFGEGAPQWVSGRWSIRLFGPDPVFGKWVQLSTPKAQEKRWKWFLSGLGKKIVEASGSWEFHGSEPRFEAGQWTFSSAKPDLVFLSGEKRLGAKIYPKAGHEILVAKDSEKARSLLESFQQLADETRNNSIQPPQEVVEPGEYRISALDFGSRPGKWFFYMKLSNVERCYVYIPYEILNQVPNFPTIDSLPHYFSYSGPREPTLNTSGQENEWIFQKNRPQTVLEFTSLDFLARELLLSRYAIRTVKEEIVQAELPQTRLKPLSLALYLSELMIQSSADPKKITRSYCGYVSKLLNGLRAELWFFRGDQWNCANTHDGTTGKFIASLKNMESFPRLTELNTIVSPILGESQDGDELVIGALILGAGDVSQLSVDSIFSYSVLAKGLICSFRES